MSSFVRRLQRQLSPSQPQFKGYGHDDGEPIIATNPPRRVFYMGRGSKLGVSNPKDKALIARSAREAKRQKAVQP